MIIDIEGTDGSGKHTQTKLLYEYLVNLGYNCLFLSFPNYESASSAPVRMYMNGELGDKANCLNGYQASALYAVDRLMTMKKIDLSKYDYVLLDRYTPSNMIHQSTRINSDKELNEFLDWVYDFEYNKLDLPVPDKIIFLDMPTKQSISLASARTVLKSGGSKDILEQDMDYVTKSYNRAKFVAKKYNWITISCIDKQIKQIEEIHKEILTKLDL